MEAIELVKLIAAVALPFILYILHGIRGEQSSIRRTLHDLRNDLQPLVSKVAVLEATNGERKEILDVLRHSLNR